MCQSTGRAGGGGSILDGGSGYCGRMSRHLTGGEGWRCGKSKARLKEKAGVTSAWAGCPSSPRRKGKCLHRIPSWQSPPKAAPIRALRGRGRKFYPHSCSDARWCKVTGNGGDSLGKARKQQEGLGLSLSSPTEGRQTRPNPDKTGSEPEGPATGLRETPYNASRGEGKRKATHLLPGFQQERG